jgi:hypothetical protein
MTVEFTDPSNNRVAADAAEIMRLVAGAGAAYWRRQSGMAMLRWVDGPLADTTLGLIVEPGIGVMLRYTPQHGEDEYVLVDEQRRDGETMVVVYPGGDAWEVPRKYFVDLKTAEQVLSRFIQSGERLDGAWLVLGSE